MARRLTFVVVATFLGSSALGWLSAAKGDVEIAHAQTCGTFTDCGADTTVTSALEVNHIESPAISGDPVEPDNGETWEIEAVWAHQADFSLCACSTTSTTVTADVTWTGSAWSVSCTGCDPTNGPIRSISICDGDECGGADHAWSYTLIVDIDKDRPDFCSSRHLHHVEYTTTSIDDGDVINTSECEERAAVSPVSQVVGATDYGAFECAFNCNATPVTTDIVYQ